MRSTDSLPAAGIIFVWRENLAPGSTRLVAIYFLLQKVDVAANTMATAASESVPLVTAGLQICLQFDRVGVRGDGSLLANTSKASGMQLP